MRALRSLAFAAALLALSAAGARGGEAHACAGRTLPQVPAGDLDPKSRAVYVSPLGHDGWSGRFPDPLPDRSDGPMATIEAARDAVRAGGAGHLVVVRGGDYYLGQTVNFDARDAGLRIVAAAGETPILHGGPRVMGWRRGPDGVWSAPLRLQAGQGVGDLFVDGVRQVEARYPNLPAGGGPRDGWLFAAQPAAGTSPWQGNQQFRFHRKDLPRFDDTAGMVVHIVGGAVPGSQWGSDTLPVVSIDYASATIHTRGTAYFFTGTGSRYFLSGARAFLDTPREWWYDAAKGRLLYIPSDPDIARSATVAGVLPTFFRLHGAAGMVVSGLEFRDGAPEGTGKYGTDTRGFGAVRVENADEVTLSGNVFRNVGVAIHVSESRGVTIAANRISHTAGNGIYLGTNYGTFGKSDGAQIVDNTIRDVGEVYFESAGIWFQAADHIRVAHNLIVGAAQFGIAGGSIWGRQDASYDDVIEYNVVRDANRQTADGGAIKLMGAQADRQNSIIRYNLISGTAELMNRPDGTFWPAGYENTREWPSPISWAIYLDGKASGIGIIGNILKGNIAGIGINGGWSNRVIGNVITAGTGTAFRIDDSTGRSWFPAWAQPNRIEGNIVRLSRQNPHIAYVYAPGNGVGYVKFARNLYAGDLDGESFGIRVWPMRFDMFGDLAEARLLGLDTGSIVADPQFRDPAADDFRLQAGSPAYGEGFQDIPVTSIGPCGG